MMRLADAITTAAKLVIAALSAVVVTVTIGMFFGIPRDVRGLEERLQAFEDASYRDGRAVSDEERSKALVEEGHTFHLPGHQPPASPLPPRSVWSGIEDAIRWYPAIFGVSLLAFLVLLRPGAYAGMALILAVYPSAVFMGVAVSLAVGAAGFLYAGGEMARRRIRASTSATKPQEPQ